MVGLPWEAGSDCSGLFNAAADIGLHEKRRIVIPPGTFRLEAPWLIQRADPILPQVVIEGAGQELTTLHITHRGPAMICAGRSGGNVGSGYMHIRDLTLLGDLDNPISAAGLEIFQLAWFTVERVAIRGFIYGAYCTGILTGTFVNCVLRENVVGFHAARDDMSAPNALTIDNCEFGMNWIWGLEAHEPASLIVRGGAIEGNGWLGNGVGGGMRVVNAGKQGAVGCDLDGIYFEHNAGIADVLIQHGPSDCIYTIDGCSFVRLDKDKHVANNIRFANGAGKSMLVARGNGFRRDGNYVEDMSRKYVAVGGPGSPCEVRGLPENLYQNAVAT